MRLAIVGVGHAGSRVTNRILAVERATDRSLCGDDVLLVNTAPPRFADPELVPEGRRLAIGDVHRAVTRTGTDGDPDLGATVARDDAAELLRAIDDIEFFGIDGILVVAGLGGGTGGGAGAVVVDRLQAICDHPVYGLGILPSEAEGAETALTAARSLRSFVETADNVVCFDNEAWLAPEAPADDGADAPADAADPATRYAAVNDELATRIVSLFAAGEGRGGTRAETLLDPSDLMRTLETGGVSAIGYAATEVPAERSGLLGWLAGLPGLASLVGTDERPFAEVIDVDVEGAEPTSAARIERLVRTAVREQLTVDCAVSSADRALVLLAGPPSELSRKGFETGRYWLETEADVAAVMAGDEPRYDTSLLTATVLLSTVTDVPRIEAMQAQAADALAATTAPPEAEAGWQFGD